MTASADPLDLDAVATTAPLPEVVEAVREWLGPRHANPSSIHSRGQAAARALEEARLAVADLVGARPEEIVFTSGATESNNLAVRGAARIAQGEGRPGLAVASHEHPSLLHPCRSLEADGFEVHRLAAGRDGEVRAGILPDRPLGLVAVSHAHAELGTLQPARALALASHERGAPLLLDATLSAGRVPIDLDALGEPDLVSLSFHHFGGLMGTGALIVRRGLSLRPLLQGGAQEAGRRPGSPSLAGCIAAGVAARVALRRTGSREAGLRRGAALLNRVLREVPGVRLTGPPDDGRLPGHVSFTVDGVDGEALVVALSGHGILAATGSACADRAGLASAALRAAGYSEAEARAAVVFCLSPTTPWEESSLIDAVACLRHEAERLRALRPRDT